MGEEIKGDSLMKATFFGTEVVFEKRVLDENTYIAFDAKFDGDATIFITDDHEAECLKSGGIGWYWDVDRFTLSIPRYRKPIDSAYLKKSPESLTLISDLKWEVLSDD